MSVSGVKKESCSKHRDVSLKVRAEDMLFAAVCVFLQVLLTPNMCSWCSCHMSLPDQLLSCELEGQRISLSVVVTLVQLVQLRVVPLLTQDFFKIWISSWRRGGGGGMCPKTIEGKNPLTLKPNLKSFSP